MPLPNELSPGEVKRLIDSGRAFVLLDVRQPEEVDVAHIAGSVHIPMGEIPGRLHELDPDADIVVYCHHGIRSADVAAFLRRHEFGSVANLSGGIEAWSLTIDRSLARY